MQLVGDELSGYLDWLIYGRGKLSLSQQRQFMKYCKIV